MRRQGLAKNETPGLDWLVDNGWFNTCLVSKERKKERRKLETKGKLDSQKTGCQQSKIISKCLRSDEDNEVLSSIALRKTRKRR